MKNSIRPIALLYVLFIFMPLIITLILLPQMPAQIPAHFNASGLVDRWGSKYESLIFPIVILIVCPLFSLIFERAFSSEGFRIKRKIIRAASFCMIAVFSVINYYFLFASFNSVTDISKADFFPIASAAISLMTAFLGNLFPKCKQNALVGIRTKWTLQSEDVWYQTHRFGGKIWFYGGLILAVFCGFILKGVLSLAVSFSGILLLTIIIVIYSYVCFKRISSKTTII